MTASPSRPTINAITDSAQLLSYDDALAAIAHLVGVARSRGEALRSPIVLVGGTALAGWKIRTHSHDVDLYMPEISADAVELAEQQLQARFGTRFRLDVTTGENVWGPILGFADALVAQLGRLFGSDPVATIGQLEITAGQRELLLDSHRGNGST